MVDCHHAGELHTEVNPCAWPHVRLISFLFIGFMWFRVLGLGFNKLSPIVGGWTLPIGVVLGLCEDNGKEHGNYRGYRVYIDK